MIDSTIEADVERLRRLQSVGEAEFAHEDVDTVAPSPEGARPVDGGLREVTEAIEFHGGTLGRQRLADVELDRLRIDAGRQRPAAALELLS